jgi:hypothetical protein
LVVVNLLSIRKGFARNIEWIFFDWF